MKPFVRALGVALTALGLARSGSGADLGMPAPPLKIAKWIKGGPVDLAAGIATGTNIYVVEFWATWCPPCRVSIPHLTDLQKRFKNQGVTVIGISNELEGQVRPFVGKQGDQMDYVVALDDGEKTSEAYMKAFEQNGIPHAFVIDRKGRVAWQGHPMAGLDKAIEEMVAGRFDLEAARRAVEAERRIPDYLDKAAQGADAASLRELGDRILKDGAGQPSLLNEFAWALLTNPRIKTRDVDLATRAAKAAYDGTDGKDASIVDTYARAFFVAGKVKEAVELQKKAVAASREERERKTLEKTLQEYQAKLQ